MRSWGVFSFVFEKRKTNRPPPMWVRTIFFLFIAKEWDGGGDMYDFQSPRFLSIVSNLCLFVCLFGWFFSCFRQESLLVWLVGLLIAPPLRLAIRSFYHSFKPQQSTVAQAGVRVLALSAPAKVSGKWECPYACLARTDRGFG